jgi:phosphoenolpyruvate-protein kinase (PTS system EI component)
MIETPSSALLADQLITEADFLSIGTNDLTQYTLAIDRTHATLSKQLDALHPAVLRLIAKTAKAANAAGKIAAICGGLAADPAAVPVLIGLGVKELSMPAPAIPRVKTLIRALHIEACRALAAEALACDSAEAVRALLKEHLS